jgi:anti-sigma B factor antagonist
MDAHVTVTGTRAGIRVAGEVDAHTSIELERAINDAFETGATTLEIDVSDMSFIDSSGLRVLVHGRRRATDAGGTLALLRPRDTVVRLLDVTGLRELLQAT